MVAVSCTAKMSVNEQTHIQDMATPLSFYSSQNTRLFNEENKNVAVSDNNKKKCHKTYGKTESLLPFL